ncbi:NAD(P)-binding protein [Aspergillus ibericus CBS 121593]|uniref:NAD(P)-binding protein n=1 Tax=Aspergillus ibericus CBS 121593 TaxID=1448316 RepID=A0A395H800_9EURO|nr:NAD(P)-binding protein [Aspergillus ibericus CBS 121593]RAL03008.1 NAD(P)-binding protein [Aspergillus ibericus CBS 121593]
MSSHTVAVFPASGGIGGGTVKHLLPRLQAEDLIFIARHPQKLTAETNAGATIRKADYDNDSDLEHAFDGVHTLFLISYASVEHEYRAKRQQLAIDAAIRSGVKYIFYGSLGYGGPPESKESVAHVMQAHLDTERYLDECTRRHPGFEYTVIREGLYSESYPLYTSFFDPTSPSSTIKIPHDGSGPGIAWVKREELGEGSAELIARFVKNPDEFQYRGRTVLFTGGKTLTLKESVEILSKVAKRLVQIQTITQDEFAALPQNQQNFTYHGMDHSKLWTSTFEAFRRGEGAYVDPLLKELLGREPEDFETTVSRQ